MLKRNDIKKPWRKVKGQSTVEYIILVAAVIGALLAFLPGTFRDTLDDTLTSGTNGMSDLANRLSVSHTTPK